MTTMILEKFGAIPVVDLPIVSVAPLPLELELGVRVSLQ